jgi:hypothetical protein
MHCIAGLGTLILLRPGSEAVPDVRERIAYLEHFPERWRLGWILWMLAALSLLAFYAWWASRIHHRIPVAIAALGMACDWSGESIFIAAMPHPDSKLYREAALLTGGAGNGLYTLAAMALTVATPNLPWRGLAWAAWTAGIGLSIATILNSDTGVTITSAVLMICFIPWVVIAGRKLR